MLKTAIGHGCMAGMMTKRLGWARHKVIKTVMAKRANVNVRDVAEWFFAINPQIELDFKLHSKRIS